MVASATGGRLAAGSPDRAFDTVSTDSRSLTAGSLFIALRGDRFDGHAFVDRALDQHAAGLLVSTMPSSPLLAASGAAVILVDDTLEALQRLGRAVRRQSGARVVAITGSAGKTTTKEVAAEFLSARYRVFRNKGNFNNHIGLPLSLIELHRGPEVAVVELGMNHAGEIQTLVRLAEPDVRVWLNVGDAHLGHFESRESLARAKAEILGDAAPSALVVVNADDTLVMSHMRTWTGRRMLFGEAAGADVRARHVSDRGFDGTTADVETAAGRLHLAVPLAGRAQLSNVLAAVAVAVEFGIRREDIETRTAALHAVPRRGEVTRLSNGVRLVDDSYNASPAAMRAMLAALAATPATGRRVAVLGEMLELGGSSRALHETCGRAGAAAGVDVHIVIGGSSADGLVDGAVAAGLVRARVHRFADSASALADVPRLVRGGDLVLVKGSRGTRTDLVADRLKEVAG
jgi:UDP-N-acetylmuramoyl-tripeptide--D-alanyl-D-alanine ligase